MLRKAGGRRGGHRTASGFTRVAVAMAMIVTAVGLVEIWRTMSADAAGNTERASLAAIPPGSAAPLAPSLSVTVANPTGDGYFTAYPCDWARPLVSHGNFQSGLTTTAHVIVRAAPDRDICVWTSRDTDVIVDANGWFDA